MLLSFNYAYCQPVNLLTNGEIKMSYNCIYPHNHQIGSQATGCQTFTRLPNPNIPQNTPCIPNNWFRTHGSPRAIGFVNGTGYNDYEMEMWSHRDIGSAPIGDGVVAKHTFTPGVTYYIHVQASMGTGWLKIWLVDNTQLNSETPLNSCEESLPNVPTANKVHVADLASTSSNTYTVKITVPQQANGNTWDKLWIYPEALEGDYTSVYIETVYVFDEDPCGQDIVYSYTGFPTPSGVYYEKSFTAGSNGSGVTFANPNGSTTWRAAKTELIPNFEADMTGTENFFMVVAEECWSGYNIYTPPYSKPKKNSTTSSFENKFSEANSKIINKSNIELYPNPNSGSFTLELPTKGSYEVQVVTMIGTTIYKHTFNGTQKAKIQLDNNLPDGNYSVHIIGDGMRHIEKISVIR